MELSSLVPTDVLFLIGNIISALTRHHGSQPPLIRLSVASKIQEQGDALRNMHGRVATN
jgi:hypothetical protein